MGETAEMAASDAVVRVADNPELSRYEISVDGTLAGFTTYRLRPGDRIIAVHSEVFPEFEHRGLASELAREMLDDIRGPWAARRAALPVRRAVHPRSSRVRGFGERHSLTSRHGRR